MKLVGGDLLWTLVLLPNCLLGMLRSIEVKFVQIFNAWEELFQGVSSRLHQGFRLGTEEGSVCITHFKKQSRTSESIYMTVKGPLRLNLTGHTWDDEVLYRWVKWLSGRHVWGRHSTHPRAAGHRVVGQGEGCSGRLRWQVLQERIRVNEAELSEILQSRFRLVWSSATAPGHCQTMDWGLTIARFSTCLLTDWWRKYCVRNWLMVGAARSKESTLSTRCSILNTCFLV